MGVSDVYTNVNLKTVSGESNFPSEVYLPFRLRFSGFEESRNNE